ncbi:MAG: plasmid recombination protein [Bacteroidetes bacterium]|nr:plasmid recombination protein [Bacteroidota bacterium]
MAYGVFRVRNLTASEVAGCQQHNLRQYEKGNIPENVKPEMMVWNTDWIVGEKATYKEAIDERLKGLKVRSNSVVAIEFVMGASPEFFKGNYDARGYLSNCRGFIADIVGWENVIAFSEHFDEKTPHVHMLVTPIVEKEVKWKNRYRETVTVKRERRLCARDITGGPSKLRKFQDDFYQFIKPYGVKAGVPFYRGTFAEEQLKVYSKRTDHRVDLMNQLALQAQKELDAAKKKELNEKIVKEQKVQLEETKRMQELQKKIDYRKKMNKGKGWTKGDDFFSMGGGGMGM